MQNITIKWVDDTYIYVKYGEKIYEKIVPTKVLKIYKNDKDFKEAYTDFLNQDNLFPISNLRFGDTVFSTQPVKSSHQEPIAEKKENSEKTISIDEKRELVDKKIMAIIKELELTASNDPYIQLGNICKVQEYLAKKSAEHSQTTTLENNYNIDNFFLNELYLGLIKNEYKDVTNSIIQKGILKRIGIEALIVGLRGQTKNENHSANLIKLYGSYYYFDPTIEGVLYKKRLEQNSDFIMSCAGLGSETYEKWYKPTVIVPEKMFGDLIPIPKDIAKNSIPNDMIARVRSTATKDYDII